MLKELLLAFVAGGVICTLAQILIDKTGLTPARILVFYVTLGVFIYAIGFYEPLYDIFGVGVSLPLIGFGASIAKGVKEAIDSSGAIGILSGGLTATSTGITAAIFAGVLMSVFTKSKSKRMSK